MCAALVKESTKICLDEGAWEPFMRSTLSLNFSIFLGQMQYVKPIKSKQMISNVNFQLLCGAEMADCPLKTVKIALELCHSMNFVRMD